MSDVLCIILIVCAIGAIAYAIAIRLDLAVIERGYQRDTMDSIDLRRQVRELSRELEESNRHLAEWRKRAKEKNKPDTDSE